MIQETNKAHRGGTNKARAEKAGRKYPNLIDNMWASKNAMLQKLVMVANQLDEANQFKIANQVDAVIIEL